MCILCDLKKTGLERENAILYCQHIIADCQRIEGAYKAVMSGHIKPHTDKMKEVVVVERSLVRRIIDDIL